MLILSACGEDSPDPTPSDAQGSAASDAPAGSSSDASPSEGDAEAGQDSSGEPALPLSFGPPGQLSGAEGKGSFLFGVATAAAQIEEDNTASDWWLWTGPEPEGLAKSEFVGDAVMGYSKAIEDIGMITEMNLDTYRFNVNWPRVEPSRDIIDEEALTHYSALLDALKAASVRPMITVHHFSNPVWVDDPRITGCEGGPTDTHLCGWGHETGGEAIIEELAEHAALLAQRYGDRVDDWATLNEPVNYAVASYGAGQFPPGRQLLFEDVDAFVRVFRNLIAAHAAVYDAIAANDTVDADGDGVAARIGLTLSVADWVPARENAPSDNPEDIAAAERMIYLYHHLFPASVLEGAFDPDLDGVADEAHPEWSGKLDWLGVQYYFRAGVTAETALIPLVDLIICAGGFDFGSCIPAEDETWWVPTMGYEYYAPGLYTVLRDMGQTYPELPMAVTEGGIATESGERRADNIVRSLEQIGRALDEGVDIRGYYHWSLMDNFEWSEGYEPRFGLYRVDLDTYERTPTKGAEVLGEIAGIRGVTQAQLDTYGGEGPMHPEEGE